MTGRPTRRSLSLPIALAAVSVALAIALLVGWTLLVVRNQSLSREVASNTWLLVLGICAFAVIMGVLVVVSFFLVREMHEVRRHNQFIDSVTHELRSPLASIHLCLETLARPELSPDQRSQLHGMMLQDVERLSVFIDDVLSASRLGQGRGARTGHVLADVVLAELAGAVAGSTERRFHLPPGTIALDVPADLRLTTDRTSLEIVVRNLLDNAVKYSDPPPEVRFAATHRDGRVQLEVRDRGIGLDKNHLRRVFQRFYRVESEAVRSRPGTGLGLFVVGELVRTLGGTIEARSDGPRTGTTMVVTLPTAAGPADGARAGR